MGINVGLSNWIKFGRSLQKKFALACLGKKVTGKVGQNFLMYKCPVWEPWGIPRCKWGPHPKSRVPSFKIDESPTLDVRENGSGYSPFTILILLLSNWREISTTVKGLARSDSESSGARSGSFEAKERKTGWWSWTGVLVQLRRVMWKTYDLMMMRVSRELRCAEVVTSRKLYFKLNAEFWWELLL